MEEPAYPNWRKGIGAGLIGGTLVAIIAFLGCAWVASWPAVTEVSVSLSFRPWWRWSNWALSIWSFVFSTVGIGLIAACRPDVGRKGR